MKYTDDQQRVIDTRGKNILVSAAAGSGKTAVLVERIIKRITDSENPVDIDRLLIVTFTSAAAAEMRERISRALAKKLEENPENEHLQRQSALIHNAQIATIDSFCLFVIRNNFNEIGLDPAFRVADESETQLLKADVMDKLLEERHAQGDERFLRFVESYCTGASEKRIEDAILKLYNFSMSYSFPEEWLESRLLDYSAADEGELSQTVWFKQALSYADTVLSECEARLEQALEIARQPAGPIQYEENFISDLELVGSMKKAREYSSLYDLLTYSTFTRLSAKKNPDGDAKLKEMAKAIRDDVKKSIDSLRKLLFLIPVSDTLNDMAVCQGMVEELVTLTLAFKERFDAAKREKNIIDFSDMEHFALQILLEKNENGEIVPKNAAFELRDYFEEIMIDEYQDSNEVQELLLKCISGEGKGKDNRFMVGDVKQSIYKFRLARPEIFMEKYDTYAMQEKENCTRIDLKMNFRSRREVTDTVNFICAQIMAKSVGNVEYDENAALYVGAKYPDALEEGENPYRTEVLIAAQTQGEKSRYTQKEQEALLVANRIKRIVGHLQVTDAGTGKTRAAKYSDIVILFRATSGWDEDFRRVLSENGVPVHVTSKTGYFETLEIQGIVNFLKTLDNPLQDIAFYGTMRLPFFDISEEEAARIKCFDKCDKKTFLYEQTKNYFDNTQKEDELHGKVEKLLLTIDDYRRRVAYTPIKDLIRELIDETGYASYVGALSGGDQRLANLELLLEKAGAFQNTSFYGLFRFIRYLETVREQEVDFGEANILDENADVVRIMTIHKSKGLEFPVCFVCGLSKQFNQMDSREPIIMDAELGVGVDYIDPKLRVKRKTMRKNAVAQRMKEDERGEDLRVLYVALTRAKEKLILTGYCEDFAKKLESYAYLTMEQAPKLPYSVIMKARSYFDLILAALMRHGCMSDALCENGFSFCTQGLLYEDAPISVELCDEAEDLKEELFSQAKGAYWESELERAGELSDSALREKIEGRLSFKYPHAELEGLTVKTTVSELKRESYAEAMEESELLIEEPHEEYIPSFARAEGDNAETSEGISGAQFGTAVHKAMELLDFGNALKSVSEISCVPTKMITEFLKSGLAKRMTAANERGELYKEQPFVIGVEDKNAEGEIRLVQGVIDVFFYEDGEIVLADYKTDRGVNAAMLADRYRTQLDYYQMALEQITGKKVKERFVYSFWMGKEVEV